MEEIEKKSKLILVNAVKRKASDIHIVPNRKNASIFFRINQDLQLVEEVSKQMCEKLVSHFKFSASMDIGEKRKPQNGSMELFTFTSTLISLRLSTIPTPFQEGLVIRLLPQNKALALEQLPLFYHDSLILKQLTKKRTGLIILTGPTGSGKTTTLYSMLSAALQSGLLNIVTLEDPIEKRTEGLIQMEINEKAGIDYNEGLKAILRHDPDIIMIGEIRDDITAHLVIRAAMTGHLVLSTMHTKDTVSAIYRLLEFNIPAHDIEQTLVAVIAQRLVERSCPFCGEKCHLYCGIVKHKITAIYDMLIDTELENVQKSILHKLPIVTENKGLQKQLIKAYALGYITRQSLEKWVDIK